MPTPRIVVSAGELSGDELGAGLITAYRSLYGPIEVRGMGGSALRRAGAETVVDSETSASVMGFLEVVGSLRSVWGSFRRLKKLISSWKPDALVVIDYPDFNLLLARAARAANIPVFYYSPPQLWAWRSGRVQTMANLITRAAVIFPFERAFYEARGYHRATYVGHPFVDQLSQEGLTDEGKKRFFQLHEVDPNKPIIALFPGSRKKEVEKHLPLLLSGYALCKERHPEMQGIISVAPSIPEALIAGAAPHRHDLRIVRGQPVAVMQCATAGLLKSGTSNLQAAVCGLPFSMFYITSKTSELIARACVKVSSFSIVNHIRPGTINELLQEKVCPETLAAEIHQLLYDKSRREQLSKNLHTVREKLSSWDPHEEFTSCTSAHQRAAALLHGMLSCNSNT